jgi:hypothetical protein
MIRGRSANRGVQPYAPNSETPAQISAQNPSDRMSTKISVSPRLRVRMGSCSERGEGDGPCRTPQEAAGQAHCEAVLLSICCSTSGEKASLASPQFPGA